MHLIALKLKKHIPTPWLADFRDPWTGIDFYHQLKLTWLADKIHHRLEKKVLTSADVVTVVSPGMKRELEAICGRTVHVVYNGYDPEDFQDIRPSPPWGELEGVSLDDRFFILSHFGAFNRDRNPSSLWKAMTELSVEIPGFKEKLKIRLIGQTDTMILNEIGQLGLSDTLDVIPHKEHREGLRFLGSSAVLLLPLNDAPNARGILPGKMFEYLALGRPVLAIGPKESDGEDIILKTGTGYYCEFKDKEGQMNALRKLYTDWQKGEMKAGNRDIEVFSRRNLARQIIELGYSGKT